MLFHIKYFFHKSENSILTLAGTSICCITPPFSYTKMTIQLSPICGCNSNLNLLFFNCSKNGYRGRINLLKFCDLNATFIFMSKFSMEAGPQMKYELVVQRKQVISCHIMSQKDQKFKRKFNFDSLKLKFHNRFKPKTSYFKAFETRRSVETYSPQKVKVFLQIFNPVNNSAILAVITVKPL